MSSAVLSEAESWLGTPYHSRARLKGVGVDCAMLLAEVYHRTGLIPHIEPGDYARDWHLHRNDERFLQWVQRFADEVANPQPADVALWQTGRAFGHGAIVTAWPWVIHAVVRSTVQRADVQQCALVFRPVRFFRMKGM